MNLDSMLYSALGVLRNYSSGSFSFVNDGTPVTASVYKSHSQYLSSELRDATYSDTFDDLFVIAKAGDVSTWNLVPKKSEVWLDGVAYKTGNTINKTRQYWTIYLRKHK